MWFCELWWDKRLTQDDTSITFNLWYGGSDQLSLGFSEKMVSSNMDQLIWNQPTKKFHQKGSKNWKHNFRKIASKQKYFTDAVLINMFSTKTYCGTTADFYKYDIVYLFGMIIHLINETAITNCSSL